MNLLAFHFFPDVLRYLVVVFSGFVLGNLLMLFIHLGRFVRPAIAWRFGLVGLSALVSGAAIEAVVRIGEPLRWRSVISLTALIFLCLSIFLIDRWTRAPEGRAVRHKLISIYLAEKLLKDPNSYPELREALERDPEHAGRYMPPSLFERWFTKLEKLRR